MKKTIILLCTLFCMAFLLFSCHADEPEAAETDPPATELPVLTVAAAGKSDFVIVRADEGPEIEVNGAIRLRDRIEEEYGITIRLVSDLETASYSQRQEKEIILGRVAGEGELYTVDREKLGEYGYSIQTAGEKIILSANSSAGYRAAIEEFVMNTLTKKDDVLYVPAGTAVLADSETVRASLPAERFDVADRTDLVGICYSTWFDPIIDSNGKNDPPNITEVLEGKRSWGGLHDFHYWAEPALGYYRSTDTAVIRQHMIWLAEAGVVFIIVDNTITSSSLTYVQTLPSFILIAPISMT